MRFMVNGATYDVDAPPEETLIATLRDRLQLTGTKLVCSRGECGACTVFVDDVAVYSCLTLTASCEGAAVTTIEGIGSDDSLHPVQQAFIDHDALQCGFCTPGILMSFTDFLERNPNPSEAEVVEVLSGHLCRCTGYAGIVSAVLEAAHRRDKSQ
jgi:aerobic-type carbon monoxide dehydrogenase small subunit (CoxS/CutS family)